MTAAPEPKNHLALVAVHPTLTMVVAPRRFRTIAFGNVTCIPTHRLACPGHTRATGITTLCPKTKAKASVQLSLPAANSHLEMHSDDHDVDWQHEGPSKFSHPGTLILRLSQQAQEKKARTPWPIDWNAHDLGQPSFTNTRYLRF